MGIVNLLCIPAAFIFAIVALILKQKRVSDIFSLLSLAACIVSLLEAIYDVKSRILNNDIAGVMDIYPSMANIYMFISLAIIVLNIIRIFINRE